MVLSTMTLTRWSALWETGFRLFSSSLCSQLLNDAWHVVGPCGVSAEYTMRGSKPPAASCQAESCDSFIRTRLLHRRGCGSGVFTGRQDGCSNS